MVAEARKRQPLVPVRKLFTSLALVGTIATVLGSVTFSALTQCFSLTLLRVHGLDPRATGLAFWPEFLTAIASGYAFGRLVATKWVIVLGALGLGFITLAALAARAVAPVDAGSVGWLCLIAGFGAGLSVSPGLFVIALSFEKALVGRAIALLNLFRLSAGFVSAPGVEHTIGARARDRLVALDPAGAHSADAGVRAFLTGRSHPAGAELDGLHRALAHGDRRRLRHRRAARPDRYRRDRGAAASDARAPARARLAALRRRPAGAGDARARVAGC